MHNIELTFTKNDMYAIVFVELLMFNIGLSELVVIFFVAYVIVGPKDLPKVARALAKGIKKLRKMINELKAESGWDEMVKDIDDVKADTEKPLNDAEKELKKANDTLNNTMEDTKK